MEGMTEQKIALQILQRRLETMNEIALQKLQRRLESMSDDEIETLNRECLMYEMKRDNSQEFISILNDFKRATNERAGFPILQRYIAGEIAKRWRRQRQVLKDFKEMLI